VKREISTHLDHRIINIVESMINIPKSTTNRRRVLSRVLSMRKFLGNRRSTQMILQYHCNITLFLVSLSFFIFYIFRGLRDERVQHKEAARMVLYVAFPQRNFSMRIAPRLHTTWRCSRLKVETELTSPPYSSMRRTCTLHLARLPTAPFAK